jgi:di/tripeptidase
MIVFLSFLCILLVKGAVQCPVSVALGLTPNEVEQSFSKNPPASLSVPVDLIIDSSGNYLIALDDESGITTLVKFLPTFIMTWRIIFDTPIQGGNLILSPSEQYCLFTNGNMQVALINYATGALMVANSLNNTQRITFLTINSDSTKYITGG